MQAKQTDGAYRYRILNNRTYLGETTHKGASYRGEHDAIVPRDHFDAVQKQLAELAPRLSGRARQPQDAPYAGLLFDETGAAMLPTYSVKRGGIRYRYYASRPTLKGERSQAAINRIPAPPFETFIDSVLARLVLTVTGQPEQERPVLHNIAIQRNSIILRLHKTVALALWRSAEPDGTKARDREVIGRRRGLLADGETLTEDGELLVLSLPVRARFRGGRTEISGPSSSLAARPDMALLKALARAHRWRQMLLDGEVTSIDALAQRAKLDRGHVGRTLNLAFLSPAITRAIVRGEQPPGARLTHLLDADIPLSWDAQNAMLRELGTGWFRRP